MQKIIAIARNTFKEAIRNRILYVILIFALLLIMSSGVLGKLTIASKEKIIKDFGFMAINLFGVAIAVFVGVSLVYNELEKKSIYTIVSKPIGRWQFLLGKYFGLLMTVWVNVLIMSFFFLISIHYNTYPYPPDQEVGFLTVMGSSIGKACINLFAWSAYPSTVAIMPVIAVTLIELAMITSFAVLFSAFSTPALSMFFTVLTFIAGRLNEDILRFAEELMRQATKAAEAAGGQPELPLAYYLALGAAHVTPNLQAFSETVTQAIYQQQVSIWPGTLLYGVLYTAGVLALAILIFERRNFK